MSPAAEVAKPSAQTTGSGLELRCLGEAEIGDFGEDRVGRGGEEDVLRLQIAVDDALLVREGEALKGLEDDGPASSRDSLPPWAARR